MRVRPALISSLALALAVAAFGTMPATPAAAFPQTAAGIAYRSSGSGDAVAASAVTVARPTGTTSGDLLVARVANRENSAATMTASGWTAVGSTQSGARLKSWVFWRLAGAAEPAAYTFTSNVTATLAGSITAFTGVDPLRPVEGFTGQVNGTTTTFATPKLATLTGNDVALWFGTQAVDHSSSCPTDAITPPPGFTEGLDRCQAVSPGLTYDVAYDQLGAPAARVLGSGRSGAATTNIAQVLALRAAGKPITHRSTATATARAATTLSLPRPAGTSAGDVLVARIAGRNNVSSAMKAPSGWTLVRSDQSSYSIRSWVFSHVATPSDAASYPFTVGVAQSLAGTVSAFVGVDTARPVDSSSGAVGTSAAVTAAATSTTADGELDVWLSSQAENSTSCPTSSVTPPTGYAESADSCLVSSTAGLGFDVAYATLGLAGPQGVADGSAGAAATNITQRVTLRPAIAAIVADRFAAASVDVGTVTDTSLYEPSGLAASRVNPRVQYVHSEKDRPTMLALSTTDASVVGSYSVPIPNVWDWEDIATGPCPSGSCIFAGDIGLSNGKTVPAGKTFSVYRVPEPDIAAGKTSGTLTGDQFRYRYPGGALYEAEALMVHPVTGDIYVITKVADGESGIYRFPNPLPAPSTTAVTTLTKVGTLALPTYPGDAAANPHAALWYAQVSAAAIHPSANRFLIRTPYMVYEYRAPAGGTFESAFTGTRVTLTSPSNEGQGEAIDYAPDGSGYYTLSEQEGPPYTLKRVDRI